MAPAGEIRVIVADDHDLFRHGLKELLEDQGIRVVGEARDGDDAVRLAKHSLPDVVVMDLHMPRLSGLEATKRLAAEAPDVKVLVLTISADEEDVTKAILAGASGYLLKDATVEEIAAGVRSAAGGESLISPRVAAQVLSELRERAATEQAPGQADLSERELEILKLLARGYDNEEIAEALVISPPTVKNHVSRILAKLELENRVQAAVYAVRQGLA